MPNSTIDTVSIPDHHKSFELQSGWFQLQNGLYVSPLAMAKHRMSGQVPGQFTYESWRHGGWYVHETLWPNGGCGCVSRNFSDQKWRIVCDPRPFAEQPTFATRDAAAAGEWLFVQQVVSDTPW